MKSFHSKHFHLPHRDHSPTDNLFKRRSSAMSSERHSYWEQSLHQDNATRRMTPKCCVEGTSYDIYQCSLPVYGQTRAQLTLNSVQCGGNGGGAASCEGQFLSDNTPVVALSTRWFNHKRRCNRNITIRGNGHRTMAMVVDKCDSTVGYDAEHDYQPSCWRNIVNASKAVWRDLGVTRQKWGELGITWSDA